MLVSFLIADLDEVYFYNRMGGFGRPFAFLVSIMHKGKKKVVLDHQWKKHRLEKTPRQLLHTSMIKTLKATCYNERYY